MDTTTPSVEEFAAEVKRRLIDTYTLAEMLGLRSSSGVFHRVERGLLPQPVFKSDSITLWDRDALDTTTTPTKE